MIMARNPNAKALEDRRHHQRVVPNKRRRLLKWEQDADVDTSDIPEVDEDWFKRARLVKPCALCGQWLDCTCGETMCPQPKKDVTR
jgi:hypothetical protein